MAALALRAYNACEEDGDACEAVVSLCAPPWCCRSKGEPDGRVVFSLKRSLRVEQTRLVRLRMNRAHGRLCVWDALQPCLTRTPRRAMRANEETVLVGTLVVLVPYRKEHVEKYHAWMSSEEIQQQTASEPLSIAEEYAMQQSWQQDEDKLTFIVMARGGGVLDSVSELLSSSTPVGDANLFLSERNRDDDDDDQLSVDAELEVMIAEPQWRKKGLAAEALSLLIRYASARPTPAPPLAGPPPPSKYLPLPCDAFLAKIGYDNEASIRLFHKLGFEEARRSEVWREVELRPTGGAVRLESLPAPTAVLRWPLL